MPEENTPFGGEFGVMPSDERLDAVFGDDEPTDEPASPEPQDEAQGQPRNELGQYQSYPEGEPGDQPPAPDEPPAAEAEPPGEEQSADEPAEEQYVFGGRTFRSKEEAEKSNLEMQRYVTRTRQEMAQLAQQFDERQRMQEAALAELLNQASYDRAQQDPEYAAQVELARQLQPLVDSRVAPMQAALQRQMNDLEIQRQTMKIDGALDAFWQRHPDVKEGTQENLEMAQAVASLHQAWARQPDPENPGQFMAEVLDFTDQDTLELAYEIYQDPDLLFVLSNNPHLANDDRGLQYARLQAKQLRSSQGTPSQPQGVRKVVGQPADVEVPGGRTPASRPPQDEWEEVLALEGEDAKAPNPFLGSRR